MESFEQQGRSVEEAVRAAEERLGRKLRQSEYTVIDAGSRGVLGLLGAKPAVISVQPFASADDGEEVDEDIIRVTAFAAEDLLSRMGIPGQAKPYYSEGYYQVDLSMEENDGGIIIGRRGTTLEAFQHILRRLVERQTGSPAPIVVDVGEYRVRRRDALVQRAIHFAQKVKRTGRRMTMEPMPPGERRAVHMALKEERDISTYSVGNEPERKIVIAPSGSQKQRKPRRGASERSERRERSEHTERGERPERRERPEHSERGERPERPERSELPVETEPVQQSVEMAETESPSQPSVQEITPSKEMKYGRRRTYRRPRNRPVHPNSAAGESDSE